MRMLGVFCVFFASGAAGLAYEVSWTRQIGLLFGQTVQSASVVLACYFLGMAVGYFGAGRFVGRVHPLRGYAVCEIAAAAWALLLPWLLELLATPAVAPLLSHESHALQVAVRVLVAACLLMPATIALGATFPFVAAYLERRGGDGARGVTIAYALNVAGAFVGVVAATAVGLVTVGVAGTSRIAAAVSVACAVIAYALAARSGAAAHGGAPVRDDAARAPAPRWMALAAVSGFGLLALQVLYMRLFSLVLHNSVYSFGIVVAVFLVALALGSAAVAFLAPRLDADRGVFAACQAGGIAVVASLLGFLLWTGLEYFQSGSGFYEYMAGIFGFSAAIVAAPVATLGVLLPWSWEAARRSNSGPVAVGRLVGVNTLAAAAGSLAASFVLLPLLGLWGAFAALGAFFVLAAMALVPGQRNAGSWLVTAAALGFCAVGWKAAARYDGVDDEEAVLGRWESAYGWIDVVEQAGGKGRQLRQNVHYGLGSTSSVTMERRQAHIPLLLHPEPRDVLFIGLATGITAGGALDHPAVQAVDVVELVPDVARGAALFADFNRDILSDPRARLVLGDGRHHLHAAPKKYDVIVADLFVPWESHTGYLYTVENYRAALERLQPGGLFCQWIPLWQLGERELRLIADSFASVFPRVSVWYGKLDRHWTILGLIGSAHTLTVDEAALAARLAQVPPALPKDKSWFDSARTLYGMYAGDWARAPGVELNTDEHPRVEFYTPVTAWTRDARLRFEGLVAFQDGVLSRLPAAGAAFVPAAGEPEITLDELRARQRAAMKSK